MKKSLSLLLVLLLAVTLSPAWAQQETKSHKDDALGISLDYPAKLWVLLLDKKTMSKNFTKDFIIVKKKDGENYIAFHLITLGQTGDFFIEAKHYRDRVQRARFPKQSAGILDRATTAAENQKFGCDEGRIMGYEFQPKNEFKNTLYFYFLRKGSRMFIIETSYAENKTEVNSAGDLADMKTVIDSIRMN